MPSPFLNSCHSHFQMRATPLFRIRISNSECFVKIRIICSILYQPSSDMVLSILKRKNIFACFEKSMLCLKKSPRVRSAITSL